MSSPGRLMGRTLAAMIDMDGSLQFWRMDFAGIGWNYSVGGHYIHVRPRGQL